MAEVFGVPKAGCRTGSGEGREKEQEEEALSRVSGIANGVVMAWYANGKPHFVTWCDDGALAGFQVVFDKEVCMSF